MAPAGPRAKPRARPRAKPTAWPRGNPRARPPAKRRLDVVDLTEDSGNEYSNQQSHRAKRPALSSSSPSYLNAHALPMPAYINSSLPSQSQPGSSQPSEPDELDLTQEDDGPQRILYRTSACKIVGVRYYNGHASAGEHVICQREPSNPYDRNAIRIDNVMGQQIGHLPRTAAEKIAPYIDNGYVTLEAELTGEKGYYDCPAKLLFYGPSDPVQGAALERAFRSGKLGKVSQPKDTKSEAEKKISMLGLRNGGSTAGLGGSNDEEDPQAALRQLLQTSEAVDYRAGTDAIKTIAMGEEELSNMPYAAQPDQLRSTLLPYQLQALAWMTAKENPSLPEIGSERAVQLWRREQNGIYLNVASGYGTRTAPGLVSGGILADDMGLGKTLEMISLILTGGPGTTLIVAPVSVMSNWEQQIRRHVLPDKRPSVFVYHGQKKPSGSLMKYDVVITSYGKLAQDPLLSSSRMTWRRLVLDEGHTIRNAKTKVALAACNVKAQSRWVLTGTPIVNSVKDLHSIVKFLRITGGIEKAEVFNAVITRRLGDELRLGEALLQALMQDLCLRRRKDMAFVDLRLPEKREFVHRIGFRPEEKRRYDALLAEAQGALKAFQEETNPSSKGLFTNVLERLLRLRQVCNHWTLCRARVDDLMKLLEDENVVELNDKNRALLQEALRLYIEQQEDCAVCYDTPTDPVITHCKHVFCRPCITKAIQIQHKCPMCRNALGEDHLLEPAPEDGADDASFDSATQSSKTEAILQIIHATVKKPGSKIVVFSQWTTFLNIVQAQLAASDVKYTRIDGSMTADKRDRAVDALDNDDDTRVLLASLAVCSVGLNLVSADTVILSDSWWAPAIEDQAVDRVHRLGQTRETIVWRIVTEGTVEERVIDIQSEKRELVSKAFQERGRGKQAKNTRVADVLKLLA